MAGVIARIATVAFAIGLDVLALSTAIGIKGPPWRTRLRLGAAFSSAEIVMQIVGLGLGSGFGFLASLSISLDSLGVGFALPALHLPLIPLFSTVAVSTVCFTLTGIAFGAALGHKFKKTRNVAPVSCSLC